MKKPRSDQRRAPPRIKAEENITPLTREDDEVQKASPAQRQRVIIHEANVAPPPPMTTIWAEPELF